MRVRAHVSYIRFDVDVESKLKKAFSLAKTKMTSIFKIEFDQDQKILHTES